MFPRIDDKKKCFVVTANPEMVMRTKEDAAFKETILSADFVVPDGAGVVMASNFIKQPIKERIPGFDLMLDLLEHAEKEGLSCYFLGAKHEVNEEMILELNKRYPNLVVAGHHHGYISLDDASIAADVVEANPDMVFVALGSPKQETWISKYIGQFSKGLFIGVGGSFDVLAGAVKRAPEIWIKYNLEWLYRLLKQPFRLKRFWKSIKFMLRMVVFKK